MAADNRSPHPATARPDGPGRRGFALPVYPLLIAAYFPLHLMANNLSLFPVADVVRPLAAGIGVALLALLLLGGALRDRHRAALLVALVLGFVCFFVPLEQFVRIAADSMFGLSLSRNVLFVGLLLLFAIVALLTRPGPAFTMVANVVAGVMLFMPSFIIARDELALTHAEAAVEAEVEMQRRILFGAVRAGDERPSIVHIVLDGYTREDVLRNLYGFDNSDFIDALQARGFAVADRATTPYTQTLLVMNSILSTQYVQEMLPKPPSDPGLFRQLLSQRLQKNHVMRTLSELGYRTAATEVDYDPVRLDRVDRFFGPHGFALTNFEKAAYGQTAAAYIEYRISGGQTGETIRDTFARAPHRDLDAPFFLYIHVIGPHPPFDVDRHGNPVDPSEYHDLADGDPRMRENPALQRVYRAGYLEKLRFVNDQVLAYVDRVLAEVPGPKVVIVHGDHGGGMYLNHRDHTAGCLKERFSPLLAVYSSDGRLQRALPEDTNLVNLYRVIFGTLFTADLPLLPSRNYFSPWPHPDRFESLAPARIQTPCAAVPAAGRALDEVAEGGRAVP